MPQVIDRGDARDPHGREARSAPYVTSYRVLRGYDTVAPAEVAADDVAVFIAAHAPRRPRRRDRR